MASRSRRSWRTSSPSGRAKAGAELLRGGGGEPVRQGGLELGDAPRDCLVRRMDSKPGGRQKGHRIHAGGVRVFGGVDQHLGQVDRRHDERHAAVTTGGIEAYLARFDVAWRRGSPTLMLSSLARALAPTPLR